MDGLKVVSGLMLCMLVVSPIATTALTCGDVSSDLSGCLAYLLSGGSPSQACCSGVSTLNSMAQTTPDRQTACRCLQNAARQFPNINSNLAETLPAKCGVNIPYKISTSTNCNNVK